MASRLKQRHATTEKRLRALEHEMRLGIWRILIERAATIGEMTAALGLPRKDIANVRYHTHYLVKLGMVEEVDRREVNGHVVMVYKAMEKALIKTEEWDRFRAENPELADHFLGELGQMHLDLYLAALKAGTLGDDEQWHVSCTPMILDQRAVEDGVKLYDEFMARMSELEREAAERRKESGDDAIHVESDLAFFKTPRPA